MGNGLSVLPGGWHDGEVVKRQARQARQGRVPAISRSTSEPTGDAIPHPQPNCVCDLRNTGGVAGFGSGHGWSASKANMRSLAHAKKTSTSAFGMKASSFGGQLFGASAKKENKEWLHTKQNLSSLTAGKEIQLTSRGNVKLQSTVFDAGSDIGITSKEGVVAFTIAEEIESYSSKTKGKNLVWQTNKGKGYQKGTLVEGDMHFGGELTINAKKGVDLDYKKETITETYTGSCGSRLSRRSCQKTKKHTRLETEAEAYERLLSEGGWQAAVIGTRKHSLSETGAETQERLLSEGDGQQLATIIQTAKKSTGDAITEEENSIRLGEKEDTYVSWEYDTSGLTKEAVLAVTIAAGIVTGGVGGAVIGAGVSALTSQASVNLINSLGRGEGLGAALDSTLENAMSEDSLKQAGIAMVTAGAVQGLSSYLPTGTNYESLGSLGKDLGSFQDALANNLVNATVSTSVNNLVFEGGDWDSFQTDLGNAYENAAIDAVGSTVAGKIGNEYGAASISKGPVSLDYLIHKGAHAALGCGLASAKGGDCGSGAAGAVIGEVVGEVVGKSLIQDGEFDQTDKWLVKTAGTTAAIFGTSAAGGDASVAADTAQNAIDHNLADILWDIASLGLGSAEFYLAYKDNDVAGMKDAALAMGIDLAAAAIPFIPGGAGAVLKAGKWFISPKQLQRKFRHAEAFGITGNYSLANAKKFYTKIQEHLNSPKTKMMLGTYRGNPAKLCVDKKSKLVVILKPNGDFVSGWKLTTAQWDHVKTSKNLQ